MQYLDKNSLSQTIDNVSEAIFFNLEIDKKEKVQIADFIINQQSKPEAYADTFAPTENDLKQDLLLFTGEKIRSRVGKRHMIGEEASRILRKLDLDNDKVNKALKRADTGLQEKIDLCLSDSRYVYGTYCCKTCSCGMWMNMSSGGTVMDINFLKAGMDYLKTHRDGKGRWKGFPFYYTLYVLNEADKKIAMDELQYAAEHIAKRRVKQKGQENKYELRRQYICERILDKVKVQ